MPLPYPRCRTRDPAEHSDGRSHESARGAIRRASFRRTLEVHVKEEET
ncbi:hypothetical protein GCM10009733_066300 [Nonomuraea maheshkhaliensis]|uniref:Uncharacterized protein n=1 Tax=Nonomuraea maheshkhaliensis TaxID=419590 RepID=A0ABP4RRB2_9ACTN